MSRKQEWIASSLRSSQWRNIGDNMLREIRPAILILLLLTAITGLPIRSR